MKGKRKFFIKMHSKLFIISIFIIISITAGYFLFVQKYGLVNQINTNAQHTIPLAELTQTKQLFEKNKLDTHGLQFTRFQADNENQPQAIYEIHVSANQFYNGLPIFLGNNTYHFNKSTGILESVSGKRITNLDISTAPYISAREAAKKSGVVSKFLDGELGIYSIDPTPGDLNSDFQYMLAWKITPRDSGYPLAFVDAITGKVLYYFNGIFN